MFEPSALHVQIPFIILLKVWGRLTSLVAPSSGIWRGFEQVYPFHIVRAGNYPMRDLDTPLLLFT